MKEVLLSRNAILIYEVLVIIILIAVLIVQKRKGRKIVERKKIADKKTRNSQLEEQLKNPDSEIDWRKTPNPFEVQYTLNQDGGRKSKSEIQIEIEVYTEMSVQHYLFDLNEKITIGGSEKNALPLNDQTIAERSCSIVAKNKSVYIKNENENALIYIQRGKNSIQIKNQIIKLQDKDNLQIGKTTLHISLYENFM